MNNNARYTAMDDFFGHILCNNISNIFHYDSKYALTIKIFIKQEFHSLDGHPSTKALILTCQSLIFAFLTSI